jgi:hypothetical protein
MIEDARIYLCALWVALMLTYLLGDVLRIFSGDFKAGEINGMQVTQAMWLGIAFHHGFPVAGRSLSGDALGAHYRCGILFRIQSVRIAHLSVSL